MPRHASFRFRLELTVEQERGLFRHVGAARFAFNQALQLHKDARSVADREQSGRPGPGVLSDGGHAVHAGVGHADRVPGVSGVNDVPGGHRVPWTGFDLINAFNTWKRSEAAGRRFVVDQAGTTRVEVTGLVWRDQVVAQVFEEACVDLGRGLKAFSDSRASAHGSVRVGFPRFKKKNPIGGSFRIRNNSSHGRARIRIGDGDRVRSVSLPKIGVLRVRECTRRLRRMITKGRARILHVTVSRGASGWWISITVEAADLHPAARHAPQPVEAETGEDGHLPAGRGGQGWVGVDRGLHALAVAGSSDGTEVLRVDNQRAFRRGLPRLRRLSKAVSRKKKGSKNRRKAVVRLGRQHARIRDRRRHVLHQVSNQLVKTHARLVLEDLNITGMTKNRKLSRAISDAAWGELARQITYKQAWRGGQVVLADRWFPSSKTCSSCGAFAQGPDAQGPHLRVPLVRACHGSGSECRSESRRLGRERHPTVTGTDGVGHGVARVGDRQAAGPVNNAHRQDTPTRDGSRGRGGKGPDDVGTRSQTAPVA